MTGRLDKPVLLLDLGGVLADLGNPAAAMGLEIGEAAFWRIWLDSPAVEAFERGRVSTREFCEMMAVEFGLSDAADFDRRFRSWELHFYPGIADCLHRLAAENVLALLSNTNEVHWQQVTQADGAFSDFTKCFLSFETGWFKPEDAAFHLVSEHFGCAPEEVAYLDDSRRNVVAARRLGFDAHCVAGPEGLASWARERRR
jgi:HAD superfamily hydrolase (TIGR01509 family)